VTAEQELAQRAVEAARAAHAASAGTAASATTSPAEVLSLDHAGFHPAGVVSGTSVTRIRTAFTSNRHLGELESMTEAMDRARTAAVTRLLNNAKAFDAVGVVDVRARLMWHGRHTRHTLELTLMGTAVTGAGYHRRPTGDSDDDMQPFAATLDGVATARLAWSGWQPVGLAIGVAVFGFPRRRLSTWAASSWRGGEATQATEALYGAREAAMARLNADADRLGADGVLGVDLRQDSHVWGHRAIEFSAVGTAVARSTDDEEVNQPQFAVSLEDGVAPLVTDLR